MNTLFTHKKIWLLAWLLLLTLSGAMAQNNDQYPMSEEEKRALKEQVRLEAKEALAQQVQEEEARVRLIMHIAIGVVVVVSFILVWWTVVARRANYQRKESLKNNTQKAFKVEVDQRGNPVFENKVWRDVNVIFFGFSSIPLLVWICSRLIPNFTGWELYVYGGIFTIVGVMPFTVAHAWKRRRRFVVSPEGLYINDAFFTWSDIHKLEITQANASYPEIIIYLPQQNKEEHPLIFSMATYKAFYAALTHYLGNKVQRIYRHSKQYGGSSSAYHDPW